MQAVVWFSDWMERGDRSLLERAIEYNADDCRATRVLKDWLAAGPGSEPAGFPRAKRSHRRAALPR